MTSSLARLALAVCLMLGPLSLASPAPAQSNEAASKEVWQNRYRSLLRSVEQTRTQLADNRAAYTKAKQRDRFQGSQRDQLVSQIEADEKRLAELEAELAALPDEARRAGVPPGWLREVEG